jgi:putative DNA primase/helicase
MKKIELHPRRVVEPLRSERERPKPYPVNELGELLGSAVLALHESIRAPVEMCGQAVLSAASLAAQAHVDVQLPSGQKKPVSLFFLTVGDSGERKSTLDDVVLKAAQEQERINLDRYELQKSNYEHELEAWEIKAREAKGKKGRAVQEIAETLKNCGAKPQPPINPQLFVSEPTVPGLFRLLSEGQPSIGLFSDESGLLLGGHSMNKENSLHTIARLSKLWDGAAFDRARGGDGIGKLYKRRLSIHLMGQPEVMESFLSDRMAVGQGFIPRCLVAFPESLIGYRESSEWLIATNRPEVTRLQNQLDDIMRKQPRVSQHNPRELDPLPLTLTPSASKYALALSNLFERRLASEWSEIRGQGAKAFEQAMRIAGVLSVIDHGLSSLTIDRPLVERAAEIADWYMWEALRIKRSACVPQEIRDAELVLEWIRKKGLSEFWMGKALKDGPNSLRKHRIRLSTAIDTLVEHGYLVENPQGTEIDGAARRASWVVYATG